MLSDPVTLICCILAVTLVGLGKGGLAGVGALAMPILALAMPPVQAAAVLLPILMIQDAVSIWVFRKDWDKWIVGWMFPGALVGIFLGWLFAANLSMTAMMAALGLITMSFGLWRLWIERGGRVVAESNSPGWVGSLFGVATGFTSQIANAGGPPFQIWVTPRRLPHMKFVGTGAVLFTMVNWAKVPAFFALGAFTRTNLTVSGMLAPLAILSTLAGIWVVKRIQAERFYKLIYILMVFIGAKLLWEGLAG
jgi:uncharacterized protein